MFLGNIFWEFPKFKVPETLDFPTFPNPSPETKMGNLKILLGKRENVFLGELAPNILFLGNFALFRTVIKETITPNKSSVPHFCAQYVDSYDQTDTVEYVAFIYGRVQTGCQKRSKLFL